MNRKKVLHVLWKANFGGIEKVVYDLCIEQLQSTEIEPAVVILRPEGEFLKRFESANFDCLILDIKSALIPSFSALQTLKKSLEKFDLVHLHFFNPWVFIACSHKSSNIVYTEHGNFGFGRLTSIKDKFLFWLRRRALKQNAKVLIYNSKFTKQVAETEFGYPKYINNYVVYNGVNKPDDAFQNLDLENIELKANEFVVGNWGRLVQVKRIERLIKGFYVFQKDRNAKLLIVGDGPLMNELKAECDKLAIQDKVIFTGYLNSPVNMAQYMDVCVFSSKNEAFGLVAIESLQLKKPTIVFKDGGGLNEIISPLEPDDCVENETELSERLTHYYNLKLSNELLDSKMQNKRIEYSEKFSISEMANKVEQIYLSL